MFHFKGPSWVNELEQNRERTCKFCGNNYILNTVDCKCHFHPGEYTRIYYGMREDVCSVRACSLSNGVQCQRRFWSCCDEKKKSAKGCVARGQHVEGDASLVQR
eukprot:TRINITY_DN17784_c0_g1_i1.p2 TRINITY_DN17784_c0_g1~~TRINITY_DN17784_c0_g1_i1.p2  ORF type:complete len:104 (-),score=18.26 TRINITY_DN17784_c0_g1_i1:132-443(-)